MRRAFTTVEVTVAAVLVTLVLGALFQFLGTTRRMNDASRGSAAVATTLLLQEALAMDLRQLGVDAKRERLFDMSESGISFYRTVFEGKSIRLRPVRYSLRKLKSGNARLERTEVGPRGLESSRFDGVIARATFTMTGDARDATRYLRVGLTVLGDDTTGGRAERAVEQVLLARVPIPLQLANPELAASSAMVVEGPLLPLEPFN